MGFRKMMRKLTMKSGDRVAALQPLSKSEPTSGFLGPATMVDYSEKEMTAEELQRQAGVDHHYDHCYTVMKAALENLMDYSEFRSMNQEELTKDEMDRMYFALFDKWETLRHIILLYVMIDAELECLEVLISFGGHGYDLPAQKVLSLVYDQLFFTPPASSLEDMQRLAQILESVPLHERRATLELLRILQEKYYKVREVSPAGPGPDPDFEINRVRTMMRDFRQSYDNKSIRDDDLVPRIKRIQDAISKLPVAQQAEFKLPRESTFKAHGEEVSVDFNIFRNAASPDSELLGQSEEEKQKIGQQKDEEYARKSRDLALARLNGWI